MRDRTSRHRGEAVHQVGPVGFRSAISDESTDRDSAALIGTPRCCTGGRLRVFARGASNMHQQLIEELRFFH